MTRNLIATARENLLVELAKPEPRDPVRANLHRRKIAELRADLRAEQDRAVFIRRWRGTGYPVMRGMIGSPR